MMCSVVAGGDFFFLALHATALLTVEAENINIPDVLSFEH